MAWPKDYMSKPRQIGKSPAFSMSYSQYAEQYANGAKMMAELVAKIKADAEANGQTVTIIDDSIIIEDKK
jgi:hypothetical protein